MTRKTKEKVFAAGQPSRFFDDELYGIPRAAAVLGGLSEATIRKWLLNGRIKGSKVGDRVMIRASELARMVKE